MREQVMTAQQIRPYVGPQWLVIPMTGVVTNDDAQFLNDSGFEVLDRDIAGWGENNAIIRVTDDGYTYDYLATLKSDEQGRLP